MPFYVMKHSMDSYEETEFCGSFLRAYIESGRKRSGYFYYLGWPYCWGSFREYGEPPEGCLVIEIDAQGAVEEFRVWYGDEQRGKITRARHVRFNDLDEIKSLEAN